MAAAVGAAAGHIVLQNRDSHVRDTFASHAALSLRQPCSRAGQKPHFRDLDVGGGPWALLLVGPSFDSRFEGRVKP
jgi:hypothetical protein